MSRMSGSPILRGALVFAGVLLAGFHGWLFAVQISAGQLEDPWVIFRWLAAAALVFSLLALRKSGNSIWGRKGIAIWVLAALLHGPSIAGDADFTALALPEAVAASVLQLVSSTALAIGLWMLASLLAARRSSVPPLRSYAPVFLIPGPLVAAATPQFCPRPPPLRQ